MKHVQWVALMVGVGMNAAAEVELVRLDESNFAEFAPAGKEADAIYGDYVLRNDNLVAVIADALPTRNANMMTHNVGAALIDLTARDVESDQLTCYYAGDRQAPLVYAGYSVDHAITKDPIGATPVRGDLISIIFRAEAVAGRADEMLTYTLDTGGHSIIVDGVYTGTGSAPPFEVFDLVRFDQSSDNAAVERTANGDTDLFWIYDKWFGQAYGVVYPNGTMRVGGREGGRSAARVQFLFGGATDVRLTKGQSFMVRRHVVPARTQLEIREFARELHGEAQRPLGIWVTDKTGRRIADADVVVELDGEIYGWGRTDRRGALTTSLPTGNYSISARSLGRGTTERRIDPEDVSGVTLELREPGFVSARIRGEDGGPIPCKVQFYGKNGTESPFFGPSTGEHGVHNVYYAHDGAFDVELAPGVYDAIVSYGPEYDAIFTELDVHAGQTAFLEGTLKRVVDTPGWISTDYHSHSTPSGDNTSSQLGRVLNLLCEQIEFAPCTEHNRLETYDEHLEKLGAVSLLGTCVGMELTSSPGDLNHQNAFPLVMKPHIQDWGAPLPSRDPEEQIKRLALWDDGSDKLVQQNHPDMAKMFFDRNDDGEPDEGWNAMPGYMDVIEIHPPAAIFEYPFTDAVPAGADPENPPRNRMHTWVQLINLGRYMPGVVNTDAHYNFHGSGWIRNYVRSSTDNPSEINVMEMVHASENGQIVMTTGPFLEATVTAENPGRVRTAGPGETVDARGGNVRLWIRVQCANWVDIDRVQVLVNGRYRDNLAFSRSGRRAGFGDGVVKFETEIELSFDADAHIIVAAIGDETTLGRVYGDSVGRQKPVAVTNPIFIDVDGDGFEPNGDTLNQPLVP